MDWQRRGPFLAYSSLALFVFFAVLLMKLPLDRLSGQILQSISAATRMDWDASKVRVGLLLGPSITFENLSIRPSVLYRAHPGDPLARIVGEGITIERLHFKPSLWQLLSIPGIKAAAAGGSFSLNAFSTEIDGNFVYSAQMLKLNFNVSELDLAKFPGTKGLGSSPLALPGMPIFDLFGKVPSAAVSISAAMGRLGTASGSIDLRADAISLVQTGNLESSLLRSIDSLRLGRIQLKARIVNGQMTVNDFSLGGKDADLDAKIEGTVKLNDLPEQSEYSVIVSLTPGAKLSSFMPLLTSFIRFDKKDNSYSTRLRGTFLTPPESTPYRSGG